jgi:hypothetical protein
MTPSTWSEVVIPKIHEQLDRYRAENRGREPSTLYLGPDAAADLAAVEERYATKPRGPNPTFQYEKPNGTKHTLTIIEDPTERGYLRVE